MGFAMPIPADDDEVEVVRFEVPLDLRTVAWVCEVAEGCHASPAAVIASMLRDLREDDERAHDAEPEPTSQTIN